MTIYLEGKLLVPWLDEVRKFVVEARNKGAVCVNLEHLTYANAAGIEMLCGFRRAGIQLIGGSPLIEGLLASRKELDKTIAAGPIARD